MLDLARKRQARNATKLMGTWQARDTTLLLIPRHATIYNGVQ